MAPRHLAWTQFRMGCIPLHPWDVYRTNHLTMGGLSALRSDVLKAMYRLEINRTHVTKRTTGSVGSLLWAISVPSRSENSRSHAVQRSRSRCLWCLSTTDARCCLRRAD